MTSKKRPEIKYAAPYKIDVPDETQFDIYQFVAMLFALQGVFFKHRLFFWVSLVCFITSIFNRRQNADYKQYIMITFMMIFGFISVYWQKVPGAVPNTAEATVTE